MDPNQFHELMVVLKEVATPNFTITSAKDWPLLLVLGGIIVGAIGMMWADLKSSIKDNKREREKSIDDIWEEIRRCQEHCLLAKEKPHDHSVQSR